MRAEKLATNFDECIEVKTVIMMKIMDVVSQKASLKNIN